MVHIDRLTPFEAYRNRAMGVSYGGSGLPHKCVVCGAFIFAYQFKIGRCEAPQRSDVDLGSAYRTGCNKHTCQAAAAVLTRSMWVVFVE
jgi:hypothetical protein